MTLTPSDIENANRIIVRAQLSVASKDKTGHRFQPTGFPDIGIATYTSPSGERICIVESEQSMANRLEAVCINNSEGEWTDPLVGLPLIRVKDSKDGILCTNTTEPHRIASSYILEAKRNGMDLKSALEVLFGLQNSGEYWPLNARPLLYRTVFALDPCSLLHGFQFIQWVVVGLRSPRVIAASIEALGAEDANFGFTKFDTVDPNASEEKGANKGQVVKQRTHQIAKEITATFEVDNALINHMPLEESQRKLLRLLAFWKIRRFLEDAPSVDPRSGLVCGALSLRAHCNFRLASAPSISVYPPSQKNGDGMWPIGQFKSDKSDLAGWPDDDSVRKAIDGMKFKRLIMALNERLRNDRPGGFEFPDDLIIELKNEKYPKK